MLAVRRVNALLQGSIARTTMEATDQEGHKCVVLCAARGTQDCYSWSPSARQFGLFEFVATLRQTLSERRYDVSPSRRKAPVDKPRTFWSCRAVKHFCILVACFLSAKDERVIKDVGSKVLWVY